MTETKRSLTKEAIIKILGNKQKGMTAEDITNQIIEMCESDPLLKADFERELEREKEITKKEDSI